METSKGRLQKASQGYHNGTPPFGYISVPDPENPKRNIGVPIPEYSDIIIDMFIKYATGNYSYNKIADGLNQKCLKNN